MCWGLFLWWKAWVSLWDVWRATEQGRTDGCHLCLSESRELCDSGRKGERANLKYSDNQGSREEVTLDNYIVVVGGLLSEVLNNCWLILIINNTCRMNIFYMKTNAPVRWLRGKGTCHELWQPKFDKQSLCARRRLPQIVLSLPHTIPPNKNEIIYF